MLLMDLFAVPASTVNIYLPNGATRVRSCRVGEQEKDDRRERGRRAKDEQGIP